MPNIFAFEFKAKLEVEFRLHNCLRMDFREKDMAFQKIHTPFFFEKMYSATKEMFPDTPISVVLDSENNNYYKGINFKIYMHKDNEQIEIGDGGFVDWIGKMTGSKKNRCLISGLGLERLLLL